MASGQALLKKHPDLSKEEFYQHWEKIHAHLILPWALDSHIETYTLVRVKRSTDSSINADEWDGAAEIKAYDGYDIFPQVKGPDARAMYFDEVIIPDEKRLLFSEGAKHLKIVPLGTVDGEKFEVIKGGKACVEVEGERTRVWKTFVERARKEREGI